MALLVLAAAPATALLPRGVVRYVDVSLVTMPLTVVALPAPPVPASTAAPPMRMLASPEPDDGGGPPAALEEQLLERTAVGALPRVDAHGRTSLQHYARPSSADCSRPCVAVLVTGLGLADRLTARALTLPGPVGLAFSPYADAAAWQGRAREAGHETLLMLPLQPERFPDDDAGPLALRPADDPAALDDATLALLAAGSGYVAVVGEAGAFARAPQAFAPAAALLAQRGLGLVEIGGAALAAPAAQAGLAHLGPALPMDLDPSPQAIDRSLAAVAAESLAGRRAVAAARPLATSFDRLAAWIATLPAQGIQLVPPSRLLEGTPEPALATRH